MSQADADWLLSQIEPLSRLHSDAAFIPESAYDQLFQGREYLDLVEPLSGKPLGELATNRQRAGFDTHPAWIEEMSRRDLVKMEKENEKAERDAMKAGGGTTTPKLVIYRKCSNLGCPSTTTMRSVNKAWFKCPTKRCPFWAFYLPACHVAIKLQHCNTCNKS